MNDLHICTKLLQIADASNEDDTIDDLLTLTYDILNRALYKPEGARKPTTSSELRDHLGT